MPSERRRLQAIRLPDKYRLIHDNQRTLRCKDGKRPCLTKFRIRHPEPGIQSRTCGSCGKVSWFVLTETNTVDQHGLSLLRFQWITAKEAADLSAASQAECVDLGISRNTQ